MNSLPALLPLALLLASAPLLAQGSLPTPPSLPFGLKWTMTQREVLDILKREGVEMEEVAQEGMRPALWVEVRASAVDSNTVDQAEGWHEAEGAWGREATAIGRVVIEFYRDHPLRFRFALRSNGEGAALLKALVRHYTRLYRRTPADAWSAMLPLPTSRFKAVEVEKSGGDRELRAAPFYSWSGRVGRRVCGTAVYTNVAGELTVEQVWSAEPSSGSR